jgi:hypothetical protein
MKKEIEKIIKDSQPEIQELIKRQLLNQLSDHLSYTIRSEVEKIASDYFKKELKEDLEKFMEESKPIIIESLKDSIIQASAKIGEVLVQTSAKNLTGYNGQEIIKSLFK